MGMLKRAGIVCAVPFAGVWFLVVKSIGLVSTVVTSVPVGIYAAGKYILTGKNENILDEHFMFMIDSTLKIANAPFVALFKE